MLEVSVAAGEGDGAGAGAAVIPVPLLLVWVVCPDGDSVELTAHPPKQTHRAAATTARNAALSILSFIVSLPMFGPNAGSNGRTKGGVAVRNSSLLRRPYHLSSSMVRGEPDELAAEANV